MAKFIGTTGGDRITPTTVSSGVLAEPGGSRPGNGADQLDGRLGDDVLDAAAGNDLLKGGPGADELEGGRGADNLVGGPGDDLLRGTEGSTIYLFGAGSGRDTIREQDSSPTGRRDLDVVRFDASVAPADVAIRAAGSELLIDYGADHLRIAGFYLPGPGGEDAGAFPHQVERLAFANGSRIALAETAFPRAPLLGGSGPDELTGSSAADTLRGNAGEDGLHGGAGNDALYGDAGDDRIDGGPGDDLLMGGSGADELSGGADADRLWGGAGPDRLADDGGADAFWFARGFGVDTIRNREAAGGSGSPIDRIRFDASVDRETVVLQADGDDLVIVQLANRIRVVDQYRIADGPGRPDPIEYLSFADGTVIELYPPDPPAAAGFIA